MNNNFTCTVKCKPVKPEVSCTSVILPPPYGECSMDSVSGRQVKSPPMVRDLKSTFRFQYSFVAATPGTNFWHSHTMFQRGDGHFGAYVVRRTPANDVHSKLYDFDLTEHVIIAQEWFHAVSQCQ